MTSLRPTPHAYRFSTVCGTYLTLLASSTLTIAFCITRLGSETVRSAWAGVVLKALAQGAELSDRHLPGVVAGPTLGGCTAPARQGQPHWRAESAPDSYVGQSGDWVIARSPAPSTAHLLCVGRPRPGLRIHSGSGCRGQDSGLGRAAGSVGLRSPGILPICDVRHRSSLAVSRSYGECRALSSTQSARRSVLRRDQARPGQAGPAQAANTPERSLLLVMQGLWRVNAAWAGNR